VTDYEDNAFTKFLEEKTNVHLKMTLVPEKDWTTKVNLLLATNTDLPDIIIGGVSNSLLVKFGSQGVFQPLNKLIEKHSVAFTGVSKKLDGLSNLITAPDGNIYSLPKISECYNCTMPSKLWMNKTFLDSVGMGIPKTTDEFYNVLKAFKTMDPNKNGKADEIPLAGATTGWQTQVEGFLMNAFILNDTNKRFVLENGKIQAAYTKPEWRQGLQYMKKLADEKLLDPISFSQDQNQLKQVFENSGAVLLGAVTGGGYGAYSNPNGTRKNDYVPVSPLKGPSGVQQAMWDPYNSVTNGMFVLTNKCQGECADIAMKWVDQFYDVDVSVRSRLGVPEVDWKKVEGKPGINGQAAKYETVLVWGLNQKSHWNFVNPSYYPAEWADGAVRNDKDPYEMQYFLRKSTTDNYEPYKKAVVPNLFMTAEESEESVGLETVINSFVLENIARFVLGNRDLDKDWNTYLKELDNMGLQRYLTIAQQAYDRRWKK
jgi:putative aldouronate transport system substrate-binding protein